MIIHLKATHGLPEKMLRMRICLGYFGEVYLLGRIKSVLVRHLTVKDGRLEARLITFVRVQMSPQLQFLNLKEASD